MQIVRYSDPDGNLHFGVQQDDGTAVELDGDIYGDLRLSNRRSQIAKLLSPIQPTAIFCIGLNYRKHAEETKAAIPKYPVLFMKGPAAVQNPGDPIVLPRKLESTKVDYECELA